jgi:Tfp pilus assembly protein PilF
MTAMKRFLVLALLLLFSPLSGAQVLPVLVPDGVFADPDHAANAMSPRPGNRAKFRQAVNATIQKNPRNVAALSQRAYMFMEGGDLARARRDYDTALSVAEPGSAYERHVLWSRGWASYEQGDYAATHADWQRAITLHGGRPFWAAYSLALLYWTTGQHDLAVHWYDTAVASRAEWGSADGMAELTDHWTPPQQERVRALFSRWSEDRATALAPAPP